MVVGAQRAESIHRVVIVTSDVVHLVRLVLTTARTHHLRALIPVPTQNCCSNDWPVTRQSATSSRPRPSTTHADASASRYVKAARILFGSSLNIPMPTLH
jgi:hypothetical protein